jgi:hypothetical protein
VCHQADLLGTAETTRRDVSPGSPEQPHRDVDFDVSSQSGSLA